jgi:hypothetical protein
MLAETDAGDREKQADDALIEETRAHRREAEEAATVAHEESGRVHQLVDAGVSPLILLRRAEAEEQGCRRRIRQHGASASGTTAVERQRPSRAHPRARRTAAASARRHLSKAPSSPPIQTRRSIMKVKTKVKAGPNILN